MNDEYAAIKDVPNLAPRDSGGAAPGDNGLQSLRLPAPEQPSTNAGTCVSSCK